MTESEYIEALEHAMKQAVELIAELRAQERLLAKAWFEAFWAAHNPLAPRPKMPPRKAL